MKRDRFTDDQFIRILEEHKAARPRRPATPVIA